MVLADTVELLAITERLAGLLGITLKLFVPTLKLALFLSKAVLRVAV